MPWRTRKKAREQECLESPCVARPAHCLFLATKEHAQILREDATFVETISFHVRQFGRFWSLTWKLATTPKRSLIQRAVYQESLSRNLHDSARVSSCQWPSVSTSADGSPPKGWSQDSLPAEDCCIAATAILLLGLIAIVCGRRRRRRNARLLLSDNAVRAEGPGIDPIAVRPRAQRPPLYLRATVPFKGTGSAPLVSSCAVLDVMGIIVQQANMFLGVVHVSGQRLIFVQEILVRVQAGIHVDWLQMRAAAMGDATSASEGSSVRRAPSVGGDRPAVAPFGWTPGHGLVHGGSDSEGDRGRAHPVGPSAEEPGDDYVIGLLVWHPNTSCFRSTLGMVVGNDVDVGHGDMHATVQGDYAPEEPRAVVMQAAQPEIHDSEFSAAVGIQTCWRAFSAVKVASAVRAAAARDEMKCCTAAIFLQACWRGYSARVLAKRKAAAVARWQVCAQRFVSRARRRQFASASAIQALWRGRSARAIVARRTKALLRLQFFARRASAARQARTHRRSMVRAHVHWHNAARGVRLRAAVAVAKALAVVVKKRRAAVRIQAVARGRRERRLQVAVQARKASAKSAGSAAGMHVAIDMVCQEMGPQADADRRHDTASDALEVTTTSGPASKSDVLATVRREKWHARKDDRVLKKAEKLDNSGGEQGSAEQASNTQTTSEPTMQMMEEATSPGTVVADGSGDERVGGNRQAVRSSLASSTKADSGVTAGTALTLAAGAGQEASVVFDPHGSANGVGTRTTISRVSKDAVVYHCQQKYALLLGTLSGQLGDGGGSIGERALGTSLMTLGEAGLPRLLPKGLVNTSNSCYRNAVLQCIFACKPFVRFMAEASPALRTFATQWNVLPAWRQLAQLLAQFEQGEHPGEDTPPPSQALQANARKGVVGKGGKVFEIRTGIGGHTAIVREGVVVNGSNMGSKGTVTTNPNSVRAENSMERFFSAFGKFVGGMDNQEDAQEFYNFLVDKLHVQIVKASDRFQQVKLQRKQEQTAAGVTKGGLLKNVGNEFALGGRKEQRDGDENNSRNEGAGNAMERMPDDGSTVITSVFFGTVRSECRQSGSSRTSVNLERFQSIRLHLEPRPGQAVTRMEDSLADFFAEEPIENYAGLGRKGPAIKKTTLEIAPQVFTFHLQQFGFSPDWSMTIKLKRKVSYPACLRIPETLMSPALRRHVIETGEVIMYRLFAVVLHKGQTASCGHYTTMACGLEDNQWRLFDDEKVTVKQESEVLTPPAYEYPFMLFYERM